MSPDDAMTAVCAWCEAEQRPAARRPANGGPEAHGICGTHQIELLLGAGRGPAPASGEDEHYLVIVARSEPQRFARISEVCLDDSRFTVLMDRRRAERRVRPGQPLVERRRGERRRVPGVWDDLRRQPVIVVRAPRPPAATGPAVPAAPALPAIAASLLPGLAGPEAHALVERWLREGREVMGRLLPALLRDYDSWRQRAQSAEETARQLNRTVGELQAELARRQAEIDRLQHRLRDLTQSVQTSLEEFMRMAGDLLARSRRA